MNFKKFISGVSALTIAASAFAAMAVTANAADDASANYVDSTAADYVDNVDGWTADNANVTVEFVEGTGVKMSTGKLPGFNGMSKTFSEAYTGAVTGTVRWDVGTSTGNNANYNAFYAKDSSGVTIFEVRAYGQSGKSSVVIGSDETFYDKSTTGYTRNAKWDISYSYNTVTKAVSVDVDPDVGTAVFGEVTGTSTASDVAKLATAWNRNGNGNSSYNTVETYSIASTPYTAPAGALTINYLAGGTAIADATTPDVSALEAGDNYTYAYPKYIANGGDLYKTTAAKTRATIALAETANTVNVEYAVEAEGTYYVYEFDGGYTTRADYESNGSAATQNATVIVPADGVYTVTANCYGSAANRSATVSVGDTVIVEQTTIGIYAPGTDLTATNVTLHAGDEIKVHANNSKDGIDYVILQKTGDISVEPVVETSVESSAVFSTAEGYDANAVVGTIQLDVTEAAIDLTAATYNGNEPTSVEGENVTAFQGSALITVVIYDVTDAAALSQVVFN